MSPLPHERTEHEVSKVSWVEELRCMNRGMADVKVRYDKPHKDKQNTTGNRTVQFHLCQLWHHQYITTQWGPQYCQDPGSTDEAKSNTESFYPKHFSAVARTCPTGIGSADGCTQKC